MSDINIKPFIIDFFNFDEKKIQNFKIKIPRYQRPYTWTEKEVKIFVEDINKSMLTNYYIGTITIIEKSKRSEIELLDGQQRLVTLFLIGIILSKKFKISEMQKKKIEKLLLIDKSWRIDYNKKFITSLFTTEEIKNISTFEKNIYNAFKFIYDWLKKIDNIESFVDKFLKICVIFISIPENSNPHVVFNNLNNRGISLNFSDKLRNIFLSLTKDKDPDTLLSRWEDVILQIDEFNFNEKNICDKTFSDYYKYIKNQTKEKAIKYYETRINMFDINVKKSNDTKKIKEVKEIFQEVKETLIDIKEYASFLKYTYSPKKPLPIEDWFKDSKTRVDNIWKIIFDQKKLKQIKIIGAFALKDLKNQLNEGTLPKPARNCFIDILCKIFLIRILYTYNEIKANKLESQLKKINKNQDIFKLSELFSSFLKSNEEEWKDSIKKLYEKAKYKNKTKKNNALYDRKKLIYIISLNQKNSKKNILNYNWEHPLGRKTDNEDNCFLLEEDINHNLDNANEKIVTEGYEKIIKEYKKSDLFFPQTIKKINSEIKFKEEEKNELIKIIEKII